MDDAAGPGEPEAGGWPGRAERSEEDGAGVKVPRPLRCTARKAAGSRIVSGRAPAAAICSPTARSPNVHRSARLVTARTWD